MTEQASAAWVPAPWFVATRPARTAGAQRPRVSARIDAAVRAHRVVQVVAPAGFGKTTAVADWAATAQMPVAWISLVPHFCRDSHLLRALATALHPLREQTGFDPTTALPSESVSLVDALDAFAAAWTRSGARAVVVIDDIHLANSAPDSLLRLLLDHEIDGLGLILIGRSRPADPVKRTPDAEIGVADLAFDADDVLSLSAGLGLRIDPTEAAALADRLAGWPVAVRVAVQDQPTGADHGAELATLSESVLADFVDAELLAAAGDLAEFVLASTTSSHVDARLAEALSGRDDAGALLERCVATGLFLDRYDAPGSESVYRWHEVFASACRTVVIRRSLQESRRLNLVVARHVAADYPLSAARHALAAGEDEYAAEIVTGVWPHLIVTAESSALLEVCLALEPRLRDSAEIVMIRAGCLAVQGDSVGAGLLRSRAHAMAATEPGSARIELTMALGDLLTIPDHQTRLELCDRVERLLGSDHQLVPKAEAAALFMLGWAALRLRLPPDRLISALRVAMSAARACGEPELAARTGANMMLAYVQGGRLREAERLGVDLAAADPGGIESSDWGKLDEGILQLGVAIRHYLQGDQAAACAALTDLVDLLPATQPAGAMARVFLVLAACESNDLTVLDRAETGLAQVDLAESFGLPWADYVGAARAATAQARGRSQLALDLADTVDRNPYLPIMMVVVADIYRKHQRLDLAREVTDLWDLESAPSYAQVAALLVRALQERQRGRFVVSHRLLERCLDTVVAEGLGRSLDVADPQVRALLAEHASWGSRHEPYLAEKLADPSALQLTAADLSRREKEILAFLRTTMSVADIAATLHVSVNTVKTHQRSLYRKLGVTSRRQAVAFRV